MLYALTWALCLNNKRMGAGGKDVRIEGRVDVTV